LSTEVGFTTIVIMTASEKHLEDSTSLEEEGVVADVYEWMNLHKLSMCMATAYAIYYLVVIVRVSQMAFVNVIIHL